MGVDTTARTQTVWQVRAAARTSAAGVDVLDRGRRHPRLDGADRAVGRPADRRRRSRSTTRTTPATCPRPAGSAASRTRRTASRSTTAAPPGTATFKWSRENASVVQPVVEMVDPTTLRLASLGRDDVLPSTTATGSRSSTTTPSSARRPGELRQVTVADPPRAAHHVQPARCRPRCSRRGPTDAAARHLRVKRWDQSGRRRHRRRRRSPCPTAEHDPRCVLEHGIAVSFSRGRGRRRVPARRPLDLRRPDRRHLGRSAGRRRRRSASTTTTPASAWSRSRPPWRTAGGCGRRCHRRRRVVRLHGVRRRRQPHLGHDDDPGRPRPGQGDRRARCACTPASTRSVPASTSTAPARSGSTARASRPSSSPGPRRSASTDRAG